MINCLWFGDVAFYVGISFNKLSGTWYTPLLTPRVRPRSQVLTKSTRECVQFYFLWKRICVDEYKRLRSLRKQREEQLQMRMRAGPAPEEQPPPVQHPPPAQHPQHPQQHPQHPQQHPQHPQHSVPASTVGAAQPVRDETG